MFLVLPEIEICTERVKLHIFCLVAVRKEIKTSQICRYICRTRLIHVFNAAIFQPKWNASKSCFHGLFYLFYPFYPWSKEIEKEAGRSQIYYFSLKANAATSDLPLNPQSCAILRHKNFECSCEDFHLCLSEIVIQD